MTAVLGPIVDEATMRKPNRLDVPETIAMVAEAEARGRAEGEQRGRAVGGQRWRGPTPNGAAGAQRRAR